MLLYIECSFLPICIALEYLFSFIAYMMYSKWKQPLKTCQRRKMGAFLNIGKLCGFIWFLWHKFRFIRIIHILSVILNSNFTLLVDKFVSVST